MTRADKLRAFLTGLTLFAAVMGSMYYGRLMERHAHAAGLNDFTGRYVEDANGTWWRVYVPTAAEFVRLAEDGRHYRLHYADHTLVQFPTRGWTVYDGRTGQTTVLTSAPTGALP